MVGVVRDKAEQVIGVWYPIDFIVEMGEAMPSVMPMGPGLVSTGRLEGRCDICNAQGGVYRVLDAAKRERFHKRWVCIHCSLDAVRGFLGEPVKPR